MCIFRSIRICEAKSFFQPFFLLLPHALELLKNTNLPKCNKEKVAGNSKPKESSQLYALDIKLCFSDKTFLAHFETPQVTLSDIENVINNDFNLPAEMFNYRCCDKQLNQASVIKLPCSIHADVGLLGGGKNKKKWC